jgi:hypothetical protein
VARAVQARVWVRSDGSGEFGERVGDAPMPTDFAPEFVVAAPNVLHERVTAHDHAGAEVAFECAHRSEAGLSRPGSASIVLFAYCSVLWNAAGISSSTTVNSVHARSVTTSVGSPYSRSAGAKNRRAAWVSRRGET